MDETSQVICMICTCPVGTAQQGYREKLLILGTAAYKHEQVQHAGLSSCAWRRRLEPYELDEFEQQQLRSAALLHDRKCRKVRELRELCSDINGNTETS